MLESYSRAWIEIDPDAIAHNLDETQKLIGSTKIMAIVKANAYGHGDITVAKYTENVAKELGGHITITGFVRYEKGEGLQKREDNFADEVASMVK